MATGQYKLGKKEYMRRWRLRNKDKVRTNFKAWCAANPERRKEHEARARAKPEARRSAVQRATEWKANHPSVVRHYTVKYRAEKDNRTPAYADQDAIKFFYECRPKGCHVDHIIPLHGDKISGFHVETNLQWMSAQDNLLKSNTFTGY